MNRKLLTRGAGWVLVLADSASQAERSVYGTAFNPDTIVALVGPRIRQEVAEVLYVLHVNAATRVIGMSEVGRGGISRLEVGARDILRPACAIGASAIIVVHNHPSGDPSPSLDDARFTVRLKDAADLLGIPLLDHVIVGATSYRSWHEDLESTLDFRKKEWLR